MPNHTFRRFLSLLFTCYFLFSCLLLSSFAEEPGGTDTEPTEEVTMPVTEPTEETTEPVTEPTEETTEPATEPTEETTEPVTEPTEAVTEPVTEPSEPETQPTEESGDSATEPTIPNILPISETPELTGPNLYFGQLHAHLDTDTLQNLFLNASRKENMDFCAVAPKRAVEDLSCEVEDGEKEQPVNAAAEGGGGKFPFFHIFLLYVQSREFPLTVTYAL